MNDQPSRELIHRIFLFQSCLVVFSTVLFLVGSQWQLGFFWFAFIAGAFGSSVALLRSVRNQSVEVQGALSESWTITLSPFLYGAMLAGMAYFLFVSRILSGVEGNGLLMTNLFPDFQYQSKIATDPTSGIGTRLIDFWNCGPKTVADSGKLLVWCFIAGYSEEFVTNIISGLQQQVSSKPNDEVGR